MKYVFDTCAFIVLGHYFPERFPSFWKNLDDYVGRGKIISVREVFKELDNSASKSHLRAWIDLNKKIFLIPSSKEMEFVSQIFSIPQYQHMVEVEKRLKGTPVADPFIIASAKIRGACVVTEEVKKKDASKIPNVCEHFGIECTNLESFMEKEHWRF